ncbi:MAG TPA: FAD-dependent monooxygenase [Vicinamibacterales bacterium]
MATPDVLIVGAGPAGAIAGLVAARAGARVLIVDRAAFPRDKLCGDTVNPGALAVLRRLGVSGEVESRGLRVDGMIVTGAGGARVVGRYPRGLSGRAIVRSDLDAILLRAAIAAGCGFEAGVTVSSPLLEESDGRSAVTGVRVATPTRVSSMNARVVIAADGRRSTLGFGLGLVRHPARPRRWAIGAYFADVGAQAPGESVDAASAVGEMHIRAGAYIGVAPVPGGLTNVCVVRPSFAADAALRDPTRLVEQTIAADPILRARLAHGTMVTTPVVLGPLAVEPTARPPFDGLLLAGDAAGFVDPMTGDGLHFAIRGGELAAVAALEALASGWADVHRRHAELRRAAFGGKRRFNRALRAIVSSPAAIRCGVVAAHVAPAALRAIIARAGDCRVAASPA